VSRPFADAMTPEEVLRHYVQARSVRRMTRMERHIPRLCAEIERLKLAPTPSEKPAVQEGES
jgi:hypothetical protein